MPSTDAEPYLRVEDLSVSFPTRDGVVRAVTGMTYQVALGKTLGIVGESGSGKSVSSLAVMGLHDMKRTQMEGSIRIEDTEVVGLPEDRMRRLRGNAAAMIFQDPLTALHPFYTIGAQIVEAYRVHNPDVSKREAKAKAVDMLERVGIPQPNRRVDDFPHQFSGGMRQRAMIAMSLVNNPKLLFADEPTTALDVTVQAQILQVLQRIRREMRTAVVLITHDLGVVARVADRVQVMYAGRLAERGDVWSIFDHPSHPYTRGLLDSLPALGRDRLTPIPGAPPNMISPPSGCAFRARCPYAIDACAEGLPDLHPFGDLETACIRAEELSLVPADRDAS